MVSIITKSNFPFLIPVRLEISDGVKEQLLQTIRSIERIHDDAENKFREILRDRTIKRESKADSKAHVLKQIKAQQKLIEKEIHSWCSAVPNTATNKTEELRIAQEYATNALSASSRKLETDSRH